jgi:hypothetical protein
LLLQVFGARLQARPSAKIAGRSRSALVVQARKSLATGQQIQVGL